VPKADKESERPIRKNAQKGVFRTNCMDCLDRTNVVQSVFARQLLLGWLGKLGMANRGRGGSAFEKLPDALEEIFRSQWTKNADAVSILYSGTPAMKTDFTATGKRTTRGAVNDGYFGVKRYFLGNFYDSRDQDYIDFSLGKIKPKKSRAEVIKHSACNSLYVLIFLVLCLPFR
jgi:phosphatidylinositol 4-phosphatase